FRREATHSNSGRQALTSERSSVRIQLLYAFVPVLVLAGCGGPRRPSEGRSKEPSSNAPTNVSTNKNDYPVFPDADAGADPSVPADLGGKGFTREGVETNRDFDLIGDPHAVKGGVFREAISDFPGTLRMGGPNWNTSTNYEI